MTQPIPPDTAPTPVSHDQSGLLGDVNLAATRSPGAIRPPIPASCAHRPVVGGLAAPWVNIRLADGGVDFRSPHQATYERCWRENLCQTCGNPTGRLAVLFGGPRQVRNRHFDEPPLCLPCALYASQACPMVAGRMPFYADRERLAEGHRGHVCPDAGCGCGGFTDSDATAYDSSGDPAHPWYALYVDPTTLQLTGKQVETVCSDRGCKHLRTLINGAFLTVGPRKVMLVSTPEEGRVWRRLDEVETAKLLGAVQPAADLKESA